MYVFLSVQTKTVFSKKWAPDCVNVKTSAWCCGLYGEKELCKNTDISLTKQMVEVARHFIGRGNKKKILLDVNIVIKSHSNLI